MEEDILRSEEAFEVKRAVSKLPSQEMELVNMLYYNGLSLKAYAADKNMNYYQAIRKKATILKNLRSQLLN